MIKVLLSENIHLIAQNQLEKEGFEVKFYKQALSKDELFEALQSIHILGIRSKTNLDADLLSSAKCLIGIGAFCIGTNQIDARCAASLGIPVFNAPYNNTRSVAELIVAEIISLARKLGESNQSLHCGIWKKTSIGSSEIRGKTLGIIGYGHIGSQVSVLAESLGMTVIFYDIVRKLCLGNAKQIDNLDDLLSVSDFITLHVPETEGTRNMMTYREFQKMKKGSFLLNASRGCVVNISDLIEALKSKHIAGAAIDVFPKEPKSNNDTFESPLQGLPNVILTPHIGGSTQEAQESIGIEVAGNIIHFIKEGFTLGAVNFPNVNLPLRQDCKRVVNVHQNVPGVLGQINKVVSTTGANIKSQFLTTKGEIGYLVMDLDAKDVSKVADLISQLSVSIKTRGPL